MPYADVNGQKIFFEDTGGSAPVVIFSHGFLMDRDMFAAQVEALRSRFRCIAFDQRGFGQTLSNGAPFTYWDSAQDLLGLMDHLEVGQATLVGQSQGAFISMRAMLIAPHRVNSLVLISTRAGLDTDEQNNNFRRLADEWSLNGSSNVQQMLSRLLISDDEYASPWTAKWSTSSRDSLALPVAALVGRDDLTPHLTNISVPTLVIHGTADIAIDVLHGRQLAAGIANARLVEIADAGHAPPLTHALQTTQALLTFLQSLEITACAQAKNKGAGQ
ncbi:putative non-heme bromoperoxidase BpoC [compost metagenome]